MRPLPAAGDIAARDIAFFSAEAVFGRRSIRISQVTETCQAKFRVLRLRPGQLDLRLPIPQPIAWPGTEYYGRKIGAFESRNVLVDGFAKTVRQLTSSVWTDFHPRKYRQQVLRRRATLTKNLLSGRPFA